MSVIRLQLINEYFYPTDAVSKELLIKSMRIERFPLNRFDVVSPSLVHKGYALAVEGYSPTPAPEYIPIGERIGGEPKSVCNPCVKCSLRDVCDSDECGRKCFRLFSRK